ncbi:hypothetical protein OIU91_06515 [Streptomyces sp. NBC_01456]|nr:MULTISPECIES: hypothetical protein [unclassified Streptomyces]
MPGGRPRLAVGAAEVARRHVDQPHRTMFVGLIDDAGAEAGG